jgi:hypothetical protein
MKPIPTSFRTLTGSLTVALALTCGAAGALFGVCGPFTDVTADSFCPFVLEIFTLGITKLDSAGAILQTVTVGSDPRYLVFDGANFWIALDGAGKVALF